MTHKVEEVLIEKFNRGRNALFDASVENIRKIKSKRINLSNKEWNKEIRSINLRLGRQTGASHWMYDKAINLAIHGYSSLILVPNNNLKDCGLSILCNKIKYCAEEISCNNIKVFTSKIYINTFDTNIRGYDISYLFIDTSYFISKKTLDTIMGDFIGELIVLL